MSKVTLTDVQTGYRVTSVINDNNQTIEEAFDNTISRDGSTPNAMEAPLDMGGHKVLNVTPGTAASDAATKGQLDSLGQSLPQTVIDQIATRVAAIINEGGGVVTPPGGYTNPPAPAAVTTSGVTYANVTLAWTMSSTTWAEGYYIYRNGVLLATIRSAATLTYSDTSVSPLTQYTYTVASYNETYDYESARTAAATLSTPPNTQVVSPGTPTSLTLSEPIANQGVQLSWLYNSSAPVDTWNVYRNGSYLGSTDASSFGYTDRTTVPSTLYSYTVAGVNVGFGQGTLSSAATITTAAQVSATPPAPTGVSATALSSTAIRVIWSYSSNLHDGFQLEVIGPNGVAYQNAAIVKSARGWNISSGLQPSTTYSVRIGAIKFTTGGEWTTYWATAVTVTTQSGTTASPVTLDPTNDYSIDAQVGVAFPAFAYTASGGVAPYTWSYVTAPPSGVTFVDSGETGLWGGTPASGTHGTRQVTVRCTDAVGGYQDATVTLQILPATLALSEPSGIATNVTITQGTAYASGNWTVGGGVGPYVWTINGQLPSSITPTTGATTASINGTSSFTQSGTYPITVAVRDSLGTVTSYDYTLTYVSTASANRAPTTVLNYTQTYTKQEGSSSSTILDADNIFTDPDGDTLRYSIVVFIDKNGTQYALSTSGDVTTITGTGLTFNKATGVLAGSPATGMSALSPFSFGIRADDQQGTPLSLSFTGVLNPQAGAPYPNLSTIGLQATGGDTSGDGYSYTWVSGAVPTWLSSNAGANPGTVNATTGKFVGGTGDVPSSGTFGPLVFRVTDDAAATRDISLTFTVRAAVADTFSSRAAGTWYATNFQDVYVNGVEVPSREITALNTTASIDQQDGEAGTIGTLWGERNGAAVTVGTAPSATGRLDWINDPTGSQTKVAKWIRKNGDAGQGIGWVKRLDGALSGSVAGPERKKIFVQYKFFADRDFYGRRDVWPIGGPKIMYIGSSQDGGQVVVQLLGGTGYYSFFIDGSPGLGTASIDPTGFARAPYPNPWSNTNLRNYQPRPGIVYPAGDASKIAWYEAAGLLKWSSAGLEGDLSNSISAIDYPSKIVSGATTRYFDERAHIIETVDQGWPAAAPAVGGAGRIYLNEWNVIQLAVEYKAAPELSSIVIWTGKAGEELGLRIALVDKVQFGSHVSNGGGQNAVWIGWQSTNTPAIDIAPLTQVSMLSGELIMSPNRIQPPGNVPLPILPPGFTG